MTLTDGARLSARLVIGADGRDSPVREAAGIGVRTTRYGQKALAFAVTHPEPHDNVSTEIYNRGGAFTLVPLPDHDGRPSSAVVWMDDGAARRGAGRDGARRVRGRGDRPVLRGAGAADARRRAADLARRHPGRRAR